MQRAQDSSKAQDMPKPQEPPAAPKKKVLIVDDTKQNIAILVEALKEEYKLGIATNGQKALEYLQANRPDLILLDIMMPIMDGYEVCRRIKDDEATRAIPVIFITAMDEVANKTKGFEMGAVDYITKPFEIMEVKARVRTHLKIEEYKHELATTNEQLAAWKARVEREIQCAKAVQNRILTGKSARAPRFEIYNFFEPCYETAGDYYHIFEKEDDYIIVLIDVSGKGLGAAMITLSIHTFLTVQIPNSPSLEHLAIELNQFMIQNSDRATFASGVFLRLLHDGSVSYINAGHPPIIHFTGDQQSLLMPTGPALGIFKYHYVQHSLPCQAGDLLCLYTDGYEETFDPQRQEFGLKRLVAALREVRQQTLEQIVCHVNNRVREFQQDTPLRDDKTMTLVRVL